MKNFLKKLFKSIFIFIGGLLRNAIAFALGVSVFLVIVYMGMKGVPFPELFGPVILIGTGVLVARMNKTAEVFSTVSGFVLTYIFVML